MMRQSGHESDNAESIAHFISASSLPSQQETLGQIVVDILRSGETLNRKSLCARLLIRLEAASSQEQERHYHQLIELLFGRA